MKKYWLRRAKQFSHFRSHDTALETFNTWFSLLYLLCRTLLVSLSAAQIHDESQKLANIIRAIPYNTFDADEVIHRSYSLFLFKAIRGVNFNFFFFILGEPISRTSC